MLLEVELLELKQERDRRQASGSKRRLSGDENEALPLQQHLQQHPQHAQPPAAISPAAAARLPQHKSPRVSMQSGGQQQQQQQAAGSAAAAREDRMQMDVQEALQPERRAAASGAARLSGTGAGPRAGGRALVGSGLGRQSGAGAASGPAVSGTTAGAGSEGPQDEASAPPELQLLPAFVSMRISRPALWQKLWCACQPALSYYLAPAWQEAEEEAPGSAAQSHQLQVAASLQLLSTGCGQGQQLMSHLLLYLSKVRLLAPRLLPTVPPAPHASWR
jgi:hypothetical protein